MSDHPDGIRLIASPADFGQHYVIVQCTWQKDCHSTYPIGLHAIAQRFGIGIRREAFLRRLRCRRCGNTRLQMQIGTDPRPNDHAARAGPLPEMAAPWPEELEIMPDADAPALSLASGPDLSRRPEPDRLRTPEGPLGGPAYEHRSAMIHCHPGGHVCRLVMPGHPLDGQVFGAPGTIVYLVDLWLDHQRLPPWIKATPKASGS